MSKTKLLILFTVFIDVVGYGIVIPILPYYVASFSASPLLITSLFAVFALCSFISAPFIGALSDRIGRRPALIASIASTSLGWFIFAAAPNTFFLFLGRIIDGLAAGNIPIAQSYLTDLAKTDKERTESLSLIGAVFGVAFILGPLFGGFLGSFGHTVPFWFVGILALANTVLAFFFLPETHTNRGEHEKLSLNPLRPIVRGVRDTALRPNYLAWFLFGLAIAGFQSTFALYLRDIFGFTELTNGLLFSAVGVIIALNQGLMMKHFWLKRFKESDLELWMLAGFAAGFFLMSTTFFWLFCMGLIFTTFGQSVLRVVMTSQVASRADSRRRGEVLGVLSSVSSLSMAIGPLVSGSLYGVHPTGPFILSAVYLGGAFVVLARKRKALPEIDLVEDADMASVI